MTVDDLLREAERESRRELEQEARKAIELRARLPEIVRNSIEQLLEEADDLQHARELAGLDESGAKEEPNA
ncbi:uncharacterized protein Nmag_0279 [Natrialba magadii ATCC 43099]|nr:hypothetical protein [Natrialba magadii]ADD03871.1 uncharacterized protein Nmag_0279 [Natrialba magadii ATCC 43099]